MNPKQDKEYAYCSNCVYYRFTPQQEECYCPSNRKPIRTPIKTTWSCELTPYEKNKHNGCKDFTPYRSLADTLKSCLRIIKILIGRR